METIKKMHEHKEDEKHMQKKKETKAASSGIVEL